MVRAKLGAGAFGTVFRAYDPQLDREVALKVPNPGVLDTPKRVERFLREAKAAAGLRHPHIVPVYDAGRDADRHYIAAAFIDGKPLADAVEAGPLDYDRAARLARELADALGYAHAEGVVHRDVKPANCMLDAQDRLHLMDFGLASRADDGSRLTTDGAVMGTPAYMAPEQAAGDTEKVGPAADQYACGAVLYELLTGRPPFEGPVPVVIHNQIHTDPDPPSKARPGVPKDLETIALKALAKRPEDRYADCGALVDDLRRWADGEPIAARRMSPTERVVRWVRRNRLIAALAVSVFVALTVGTVTASALAYTAATYATRAEAEAARAVEERTEADRQRGLAVTAAAAAERHREKAEATTADLLGERDRVRQSGYVADIRLAQNAWNEGRMSRMSRLLDGQVPAPGSSDLRGPEWHYLRRLPTVGNTTLLKKTGMGKPALTPDGTAALIPAGTSVLVFNNGIQDGVGLSSGVSREIVWVVAAHPTTNQVAGVTATGRVLVWDGRGATDPPRAIFNRPTKDAHSRTGHSVTYNRAGNLLAVIIGSMRDAVVVVVEPDSGRVVFETTTGVASWGVAFHPTAPEIVVSSDETVRTYDYERRVPRLNIPLTPAGSVEHGGFRNPVFTPDGSFVVAGTYWGKLVVWSVADGVKRRVIDAHDTEINMIASAPGGNRIVSSSFDGTVRVWACDTWTGSPAFRGHTSGIESVACDDKASVVVTTAGDSTIRLWDVRHDQSSRPLAPEASAVERAVVLADGKTVLASLPTAVVAWDLGSGDKREVMTSSNGVTGFDTSPDGKAVYVGTPTSVKVSDSVGGPTRSIPVPVSPGYTHHGLALHADGLKLAARQSDGSVLVVRTGDGTILQRLAAAGKQVTDVAFSPDGTELLVGYRQERFMVWDVATWKVKRSVPCSHLMHCVYNRDGSLIAAAGWAGDLRVFRTSTGELLHTLVGHLQHVLTAVFTRDDRRLISGGMDGSTIVWNLDSGQEVLTLRSGGRDVTALALSPDETQLVVFDRHGAVRVLDLGSKPAPRPRPPLPGPNDPYTPPVTPEVAATRVGEVVTVEMRVASAGGNTNLHLNSRANFRDASNFDICIQDGFARRAQFGLPADPVGLTVRATGVVTRTANGHAIEVADPARFRIIPATPARP